MVSLLKFRCLTYVGVCLRIFNAKERNLIFCCCCFLPSTTWYGKKKKLSNVFTINLICTEWVRSVNNNLSYLMCRVTLKLRNTEMVTINAHTKERNSTSPTWKERKKKSINNFRKDICLKWSKTGTSTFIHLSCVFFFFACLLGPQHFATLFIYIWYVWGYVKMAKMKERNM